MKAASLKAETVDDYIRDFPREVREVLKALRRAIREVAPDAEESISYRIPTYRIGKKPLVYFAAYQHHVSLYPSTERSVEPLPRLAPYRSGRGTLKFPLDKPVPLASVKQFVRLRLKEELARASTVKPVSRKSPSRTRRKPRSGEGRP
jgi:uncharacterized protein YdhG (YjbR/CyaY superfamily)